MEFKIGNVIIKNNLILAPMAGVTDLPFRLLCKEQGCGMLYTEMVSAKAIFYNNKNTKPLLELDKRENPIAVQLFGSEPKLMGEMAKKIEDIGFDIIDINMGCPVPKIVNNGEGSALMKNPKLVGQIVSEVSKSTKLPVTVKIRKGFNDELVNAPEIAKIVEESGAKAIAVHGRTREQYYSGKADWNIIKKVKETVSIPVIGNGDIFTPMDVIKMKEQTNCDAFMIGRGAKGNPWIFNIVNHYFETGELIEKPPVNEIIKTILRHTELMIEFKGEFMAIREMRKHIAWYTQGLINSSRLRVRVNQVESFEELKLILNNWQNCVKI